MPTQISDLWNPAVWIQGIGEKQATFPSAMNAGILTKTQELDAIAAGPGNQASVPFFKDITDQADEIQVENTAPTADNVQPSGLMVTPILNRQTKNSATALSAQVSGSDPLGNVINYLTERRMKQRQATLIAMLRGVLGGGATAANAAACLSALRYGGTAAEIFLEAGATATAANKLSADVFINTKKLLGELGDELKAGIILCHPDIKAALETLDAASFKNGVQSGLPYTVTTYREVPIFTASALVRAGTTSGFVYDTFLIAPGNVGYGEKAQAADGIDAASLAYYADKDKNNELVYDRTRFLMHVFGTKWVGTPGGQSATNAELQTVGNWNLVFQTANRCGVALIRTNG
jgi:hypothetical protein